MDLPETYEIERFDATTQERHVEVCTFTEQTRDLFSSAPPDWHSFPLQLRRWAILIDKFERTHSERVSSELRQLETILDAKVQAMRDAEDDDETDQQAANRADADQHLADVLDLMGEQDRRQQEKGNGPGPTVPPGYERDTRMSPSNW